MFLNAWEPGYSPQFAGWRVLPHFYAPESWDLPVRLGFVAEFSFPEDSLRRKWPPRGTAAHYRQGVYALAGCVQSGLRTGDARTGRTAWMELRAGDAAAMEVGSSSASLEYYGEVESITAAPHTQPEVHQLFVGGDWQVTAEFSVNLGIGFDLGGRGPGLVLKSRFEWDQRRKRP